MFLVVANQVRDAVGAYIKQRYGLDVPIVIEQPRQAAFGELALPVSFSLAKQLKQAPRKIAEELVAELPAIPGVSAVEVAGGGYVNLRFDRGAYGESLKDASPEIDASESVNPRTISNRFTIRSRPEPKSNPF